MSQATWWAVVFTASTPNRDWLQSKLVVRDATTIFSVIFGLCFVRQTPVFTCAHPCAHRKRYFRINLGQYASLQHQSVRGHASPSMYFPVRHSYSHWRFAHFIHVVTQSFHRCGHFRGKPTACVSLGALTTDWDAVQNCYLLKSMERSKVSDGESPTYNQMSAAEPHAESWLYRTRQSIMGCLVP